MANAGLDFRFHTRKCSRQVSELKDLVLEAGGEYEVTVSERGRCGTVQYFSEWLRKHRIDCLMIVQITTDIIHRSPS